MLSIYNLLFTLLQISDPFHIDGQFENAHVNVTTSNADYNVLGGKIGKILFLMRFPLSGE